MRLEIVVLPALAYDWRVFHSDCVGRRYPVAHGPTFHELSRVCFPIHSRAVSLPLYDVNDDSRSPAKNHPVLFCVLKADDANRQKCLGFASQLTALARLD